MNQEDLLFLMIDRLVQSGIPYMVVGSYTCSAYGDSRSTNDVDIVVTPTVEQIQKFVASFEDDYYVNLKTAVEAVEQRRMFNVIGSLWGWKADLIVLKDRPLNDLFNQLPKERE